MSGHSKWSTIKRKKGALDAKRGKLFTKCIHEITTAVREGGGGDPDCNPRLRLAIDKARGVNMPNENIQRAIKRATGEGNADQQVEYIYEGYGPNGTAFLVQVLTDNKNRTVGEVRHAFSRLGGNLGENGCVSYLFEKKGVLTIDREKVEEDELLELALDAGADDVREEDDVWEVLCPHEKLFLIKENLEKQFSVKDAEIQMLPATTVSIEGDTAQKTMRLLEMLEDLDDVVNVYVNCDFVTDKE